MATSIPQSTPNGAHAFRLAYEGRDDNFDPRRVPPARLSLLGTVGSIAESKLIVGENLGVLSALHADSAICGKVDLIYIDPPYATGGHFLDREHRAAYEDVDVGNAFVEFLRQRLAVAASLLSDSGSIFVHVDERFIFHTKLILDELFGYQNYRNMIVRKKCNSKNYTKKRLGNVVDYILWYTKSSSYVWHKPTVPLTDEFTRREYTYIDEATGRRYKRVPLHAPGHRNGASGQAWRGIRPPRGKHWQYTPATLDEMDAAGEVYWSKNGNPRRKVFLDQSKGTALQDLWLDVKDAHNQNCSITGYPTEKNLELVERIVLGATEPTGLVLDFFSGSGTVAEAARRTGRRWICVDRSLVAASTTISRLLRGRRMMGDFVTSRFADQLYQGKSIGDGWQLLADSDVPVDATIELQLELSGIARHSSTVPSGVPEQVSA